MREEQPALIHPEFEFYNLGPVRASPTAHKILTPRSLGYRFEFLGSTLGESNNAKVFGYVMSDDLVDHDWFIELGNTIASRISDQLRCFLSPPQRLEGEALTRDLSSMHILSSMGFWLQLQDNLVPFDFTLAKEGQANVQILLGNT